jgi:hypothetical protein
MDNKEKSKVFQVFLFIDEEYSRLLKSITLIRSFAGNLTLYTRSDTSVSTYLEV